jgi:hypothetical protein
LIKGGLIEDRLIEDGWVEGAWPGLRKWSPRQFFVPLVNSMFSCIELFFELIVL